MNVFQYSAVCERYFEEVMKENGYKRLTTFYSDLSIAEWYGKSGIMGTYKDVMANWIDDLKYITEFLLCLNHKSWEMYERKAQNLLVTNDFTALYSDLYYKAKDKVLDHYKDDKDALRYIFSTID